MALLDIPPRSGGKGGDTVELKAREIIKYIWLRICRRVYGHKYDCCNVVTRDCSKCHMARRVNDG